VNTYTVAYWPPNSTGTTPVTATVQAFDFVLEDGFLTFITDHNHALFAVPVALNPVVTQTASA
jgi:hypothetical protein